MQVREVEEVKEHRFEIQVSRYLVFETIRKYVEKGKGKSEHSLDTSLSRTKRIIREYARNNQFNYFVTLTFDTKKLDSINIDEVLKATQGFTRLLRSKSIKYLIVPELHADGRKIHLHALITNGLDMVDSGKKDKRKRVIYNIPLWTYGFSTAIAIGQSVDDVLRVSNYITKYITKNMIVVFSKKRFWSSQGLSKPKIISKKYSSPDLDIFNNDNLENWDYIGKKVGYRTKTIRK